MRWTIQGKGKLPKDIGRDDLVTIDLTAGRRLARPTLYVFLEPDSNNGKRGHPANRKRDFDIFCQTFKIRHRMKVSVTAALCIVAKRRNIHMDSRALYRAYENGRRVYARAVSVLQHGKRPRTVRIDRKTTVLL